MFKKPLLALVCLALLLALTPARPVRSDGALAAPVTQVPTVTRAQDWVQQSAADFAAGERTGIDVTDVEGGELRLSAGATMGTYVSPVVAADFPFTAIVAHWSATVPLGSDSGEGASLEVELRVLAAAFTGYSLPGAAAGGWSDWQPMVNVEWNALKGEFYPEAPLMLLEGRQFQYRMTIRLPSAGLGSVSPVLRRMTITYMDTSIGPTTAQARTQMQAQHVTAHGVSRPAIISRAGWGADERYRTWEPEIRPVYKMVVHHTVTPNGFTEDQSAAWVRAIYYYHAVTLGWGDVGYNYLVDPYGNIYEGRYGGPGAVGGHVYSYNYGSVGIALIGTHGNTGNSVAPSAAALDALRSLCVWEASRSYIHPLQSALFFGAGTPNLAGHRDYPPQKTSCPGDLAYAALPGVRQGVWQGLTAALPQYQVAWLNWRSDDEAWNRGTIQADTTYSFNISVRNTGWYAWPSAGASNVQNARVVRLGYRWLDSSGQVVPPPPGGDLRTRLDREVAYGHTYQFSRAQVVAPQMPGTYTLVWDMVHEGVTWFRDTNPRSPVLSMTVTVASAPPSEFGAVRNGGFEEEGGWTFFETPYPARYTRQVRRSGERSLQTGIEDPAQNLFSYSSAEQTFGVPVTGDLTLRYWYRARMEEDDFGYVYLFPEGGVWRLLQSVRRDVPIWTEAVHDLRAYAGQRVTLRFGAFNSGLGGVSAMYVDDVSVAAGVQPEPTPPPLLCVEVAQNGDMEADEGWDIFETPYPARYTTAVARTGSRSMQLGMTDPAENVFSYSSAEQRLSIPAGRQATLSLWYNVPQGGEQGDYGYMLLRPDGGSWRILRIVHDVTDGWMQLEEDVSHLAGQSFTLRLGLRNDGWAEHVVMYVDSVSVQACLP